MIKIKRPALILILFSLLVGPSLAINGCDYITGEAILPVQEGPALTQPQVVKNITPEEANTMIMISSFPIQIIDVRTPEEYAGGHIENAANVNYNSGNYSDEISRFDKDRTYLIYCRTGARSAGARDIMKELGFQKIYNIDGGITDWIAKGLPVVK
jgi:rhodanese-related sulfurtransferase